MNKIRLPILLSLTLAAVVLGPGCGASDPASQSGQATQATPPPIPLAQLTSAAVRDCIRQGRGRPWRFIPAKPPGAPHQIEHVFAIGPDFSHIAIYLSLQPATVRKLRRGFAQIGEYTAHTAREGHVLLLLDRHNVALPDRKLALRCIGAS